jgi:hypothetical protein
MENESAKKFPWKQNSNGYRNNCRRRIPIHQRLKVVAAAAGTAAANPRA